MAVAYLLTEFLHFHFMSNLDASLPEEKIVRVGPNGIDLAYQRIGAVDAPAVVLVMGVGAQMIAWPDEFCAALVARNLQVIRFDNRDAGHSTHLHGAPSPNLQAALRGDFSSVSYTLSDMASDIVGLLNALGIAQGHLVGASLGGAIAQTMAIDHPDRVRSLTSIMSTTGNMRVGQPSPETLRSVFAGPRPVTRDEVIQQTVRAFRALGSPKYPSNENDIVARAGLAYDRAHDPLGAARQAVASIASGDRTGRLRNLKIPTLVIHGLADRMCDVSGGRATAEAIPGAELMLIEGMGHDLAPGLLPLLTERIGEFIRAAEKN